MNVSELDLICKKVSRKVFNDAKHDLVNHPFLSDNPVILDDCIEFCINQKLGGAILKEFAKQNTFSSAEQLEFVSAAIAKYKAIVVKVFHRFAVKNGFV